MDIADINRSSSYRKRRLLPACKYAEQIQCWHHHRCQQYDHWPGEWITYQLVVDAETDYEQNVLTEL
jgi:hypothetical protein